MLHHEAAGIAIGEDHQALADSVRRFAAERCSTAVVRASIEGAAEDRPPFWDELAGLGWLGLHLPEAEGGQGYGLAEMAVVAEGLGRALAPGPFLSAVWAGAALSAAGGDVRSLIGELAAGRTCATVALGAPLEGRRGPDGSVIVSGTTGPVLAAPGADLAVIPVRVDGTERWFAADAGSFTAAALDPLDLTRAVGELRFDAAQLEPGAGLVDLDRSRVEAVAVTVAAAECAGGAAWCLGTAAAHARDRRQFGRPIGQFQAVKHRCADMLIAVESARSAAWDAAHALDDLAAGDGDSGAEQAALAAGMAGAVALDAFVSVAEDCIQVLGGIGFTWEHDAHLYLRRAVALRQLLGGSSRWRQATAHAALAGTRRRLSLPLPEAAEQLRPAVRTAAEAVAALPDTSQRQRLVDLGYLEPHWPAPWGCGAGAVEQLVIDQELRRAGVRRPHLQVGAWAAPTIVAHGTPEQQERWVRPTLLGALSWCQLFSEPEAGSDLAGLRTTATRTGGGWLLNGQKVWTTMAAEADWGICLVRTNPDAPRHLGITYVIVDMASPGIDIRPLREMTGLAMFNEVFLDDVFVPDDCVIGEVDGGWPLARTTLANERVSMGRGSSFGGGIEALLGMLTERVEAGELVLDTWLADQVGVLVAESHVIGVLGLRRTLRSVAGAGPGPEASVGKLLGVEHDQRTQELGLTVLGPQGATASGAGAQWSFGFLANRCLTIAGGTSEIQRNVIGERLLGLPRDPEPADATAFRGLRA